MVIEKPVEVTQVEFDIIAAVAQFIDFRVVFSAFFPGIFLKAGGAGRTDAWGDQGQNRRNGNGLMI